VVELHRGGRRPRGAQGGDRRAPGGGVRTRPVGRHRQRPESHLAALRAAGGRRPRRGAALPAGRPRRPRRAGPGGGRRGQHGRGRDRAGCAAPRRRGARGPDAAGGGVRRARGAGHHPLRGRRDRRCGLRGHAAAHVPAVGGAPPVPDGGLRHLLRRGGRDQVGHLRRQGPVRLRHPVGRAGHPPAGPDLALRQPGPPADLVRRRRGAARHRVDRSHRPPRGRPADRRLPLVRTRRAERQHHRLGRPDHPPAHRHRGVLPEREVAAAEQGGGAAGAAVPAAGEGPARPRGRDERAEGRRRQQLGLADALLRAAPLPDGQGPADRLRGVQPRRGLRRRHRRVHRLRHPLAPDLRARREL
ncbi:MAG: Peptide chain release factor 2, partial [uncultured Friedmanniella sp.]